MMILPLYNRIYEYDNKKVIVWGINWFISIYARTIEERGGSKYLTINWWKFMFKAKKIGKIENNYLV